MADNEFTPVSSPMQETELMDEQTARRYIKNIHDHAGAIGRYLLALRERKGWLALGYHSFSAMCAAEFEQSRKHLYELMRATTVTERLQEAGFPDKLPIDQTDELARLEPELQAVVYATTKRRAEANGKRVTASGLRRTGDVFQQLARTGHATVNGREIAADAMLDEEDEEAAQRAKQYAVDYSHWERLQEWEMDSSGLASLWSMVMDALSSVRGRRLKIAVYAEKEAEAVKRA